MPLNLECDLVQGVPMPSFQFASDNPALHPVELVELWKSASAGTPSRVQIRHNGQAHTVWSADNLLLVAFGLLLGSVEEKVGFFRVIEGSVNHVQRRTQGDPVFDLSGTVEQKLSYLDNVCKVMPRDIHPPIRLRYREHEVEIDLTYELDQVKAGLRLCKKP